MSTATETTTGADRTTTSATAVSKGPVKVPTDRSARETVSASAGPRGKPVSAAAASPTKAPARKPVAGQRAEPKAGKAAGQVAEPGKTAAKAKSKKGGGVGTHLRQSTQAVFDAKNQAATRQAANEKPVEGPEEKLAQTEKAVVPPTDESQSRAQAAQVDTVEQSPAPVPDEAVAKQEFDATLTRIVPKTLEEMDQFKEEGRGRAVGESISRVVTADTGAVLETYQEIDNPPAPEPLAQEPEELPAVAATPETAPLDMGVGVVGEVQEEHTDFSEFDRESDDLLAKEEIKEEHLEMVDEGDLAEANQERQKIKTSVQDGPMEIQVIQEQEQLKVDQEMQQEEQAGKEKILADRQQALDGVRGDQQKTKSRLELKRQQVTDHINGIYEQANIKVKLKLANLEQQSLQEFSRGEEEATRVFEDNVKARMDAFKQDRYGGVTGGLLWAKDKLFGMEELPEVNSIFESEKNRFILAIDAVIAKITAENTLVIQECKATVAAAGAEIAKYVEGLGPALKEAGQTALGEVKGKLDALNQGIEEKARQLQDQLAAKREAAIEAIEKKIEDMKEAMSGALAKLGNLLLNAAIKFFEWALKKAGMASDQLMGIINKGKSVIQKIVTDPIGFISNLVNAVKSGVGLFVTNIKKHLITGLISWLTGAMADVPITLPTKWDLKGILHLILQIMGLTWDRIRTKLVKRLGEKVVKVAETTFDIVKRLVTEGPMALWEMIKEKAADLKQKVMDGIRDWVITQVVKQAVVKLISFLNPAGAVLQAILAIYNTIMFFVENWDRIATFVKTVFGGIANIAMGKISAVAKAVEGALAMTIPIILNFLARLIGLSGIGKAVTGVIKKIQKPVDKIVDKVIDQIAKMAKKVIGKVSGGVKKGKQAVTGAIGKIKDFVFPKKTFTAGEESHTLSVRKQGNTNVLYIASTLHPISEFLDFYEKDHVNDMSGAAKTTKLKLIGNAKKLIGGPIKSLLGDIEKEESKPDTDVKKANLEKMNKDLLQQEILLSGLLKTLLGSTSKLKGVKERYKLEGLTGTYGSMPKPTGDDFTADHQPQAAVFSAAVKFKCFQKEEGKNMQAREASRAKQGRAINLYKKRHTAGRTFGGKGTTTKNGFVEFVKTATQGKSYPDQRHIIVERIKWELNEDVGVMRTVTANKANWAEIYDLTDIEPPEKEDLHKEIMGRIDQGEDRIAAQDLEALKS